MVAARTHGTERVHRAARHHLVHPQHSGACCAPRGSETEGIHCRIGVELQQALFGGVLEYQIDVGCAVHALEVAGAGKRRFQAL